MSKVNNVDVNYMYIFVTFVYLYCLLHLYSLFCSVDLYSEYGYDSRLTMLEKEFPGANILLHKLSRLPQASVESECPTEIRFWF